MFQHQFSELAKVDLTIAVLIHLANQLLPDAFVIVLTLPENLFQRIG
jgi:hypothetical protein